MIVFLDATLEELEAESKINISHLLEEIFRAHRRGYHLVVIRREIASWLRDNIDVSLSGISVLNRLIQEFSQTGSLLSQAPVVMSVRSRHCVRPVKSNQISITMEQFFRTPLSEPVTLLVENGNNDGTLIAFLLENVARRQRIGRLHLSLSNGGGADIINQLQRIIDEGRVVFCVIDRDSSGPFSPENKKLAAARKVINSSGWPLAKVEALPGREVENFIPFSVLQELPCWRGGSPRNLLVEIMHTESDEFASDGFWLNFDLKEGLTVDEWNELNDQEKARLNKILARCGKSEFCSIEGFGSSIVQNWISYPKGKNLLAVATAKSSWINAFEDFLLKLAWFFIGVSPNFS